jgi:hypothetical protein
MDTTSHNFTWQTYKVSDRLDVDLRDVSIINENNIWIVGFIPNEDEPNNSNDYNAIHWNGSLWKKKRIYYSDGNTYEINSIFCYSDSIIWISDGNYGFWNGNNWTFGTRIIPYNKIWSDGVNVWFVGYNPEYGKSRITKYDGTNWQDFEINLTTDLVDIYGYYDKPNNKKVLYSCGFKFFEYNTALLINKNDKGWEVFDNGVDGIISGLSINGHDFSSVWMSDINTLFVTVFKDVYRVKQIGDNSYSVKQILDGYKGIRRIRGNDVNDIFVGGDRVQLRHYNGKTWRTYTELNKNVTIYSLDFKDDLIVAISSSTIYIGKRN